MIHTEVYKKFITMFPEVSEHLETWFPNGKNSIRVRVKSGSDFVFTYNDWTDWCYETVESYIKKMRGGSAMKC